MTIKQILEKLKEETVSLKAWVVSNRGNNKIRFLTINDGSTIDNLQVVIKNDSELDIVRIGSAVEVQGNIQLTPGAKQPLELISISTKLIKNVDEDYPLQKQEMSREVLREIPHLRARTNIFRAVMRIRSTLLQEIHAWFYEQNFLNCASPIITSNDGEGAGETFVVDDESHTFFGKKATLGVTGQLQAESYANAFGKVYTFAPTFRAENSNTQKHAAEFWMLEPEMAFTDYREAIQIADSLLKTIIRKTLLKQKPEFDFLEENVENGLREKLESFINKEISVLDYKDAIKILEDNKKEFDIQDIKFGMDLGTEHERFIAEKIFKGPVAIINYPKAIKAFYMKQNEDGETVAAFDVLVPGIGELIGGSQRECNYEKLEQRIKELNIPQEDLQWYLDLRRFGEVESSGFGLGFERLVMYVTGINNIRDAIPFPRTPNNLKM